ncbi:hypothetical protein E4V42_09475 [Clostridium estertheticum]|uniref:Uncharacterized protein n=1 Tax=Clostridium estertheticum TaxID=238834 RepID=A0A5N7J0W2_9CLOT|nr:hypothetical protein [Clostridium estertheticum]MPQ31665.1 hypothetical protein [Clostridium estertheticum]MPQ62332.1 hypothetical protein [Clostridium estertheticum]
MLSEVINKITITVTKEKERILKERIENCVKNCLNQVDSEIKFEDNYPIYFKGKEVEKGVFVNLEVYNRKQSREKYRELKTQIRRVYIEELEISEEKIFIQFDDYEE